MTNFEFERIQKILIKLKSFRIKEQPIAIPVDMQTSEGWQPYAQGTFFGSKNQYYTFKGRIHIPADWQEQTVAIRIYTSLNEWDNTTNPQMKVYLNESFVQAIDVNHREVLLDSWDERGMDFRLELFSGREEKQFPLYLQLIAIDPDVEKTGLDFTTLFETWRAFRKFGGEERFYQQHLSTAANILDFCSPYSERFYHSLTLAQAELAKCYQEENVTTEKVTAIGHTHIDLAWLWTVQQAIEKGERSFQTVLKLMDEFPDYTFLQSQPQMYQFIKEQYPELYQAIKEKIQSGRWEVEGAMWVEADCNLTSGESLVRQLLYGKRFIKQEFGIDSQMLWLPDVFGYSAALPQLLKKTNTPYFMTTKLSWNQYNQIPYDSFYWQGIDGSQVLTHFITTISEGYSPTPYYTTYNGLLDPYTIKGSFARYQQKEIHDEIMIAYGYGDGGGGPTRNMLECQKRLQQPLPSMPTITGDKAVAYFQRLAQSFEAAAAPVWYGELYFEYHRGTLTSIGKNKRNNRQGENMMQTLEKLYTLRGFDHYPRKALEKMWKLLLLNQFHDILPGSSIEEVYQQTDQDYAWLKAEGQAMIKQLIPEDPAQKDVFTVFNGLGIQRTMHVQLPVSAQTAIGMPSQRTHDGQLIVQVPQADSLSFTPIRLQAAESVQSVRTLPQRFETTDFVVIFNAQFEIVSLFDKKHQRDVLPKGEVMNQLVAYEDLPMNYDAWDIDPYYVQKSYQVAQISEAAIVEQGPIRDTIKLVRPFEQSKITQFIHFYHGTGRIDFDTTVDWHQHHVLLKAQLPIAVNTLEATFDIQFGNVKRAIHQNTSWDVARFESCGQKWVDLSEDDYGVSVLTDSKYGFSTAFQKIGISLIKSAIDPYPEADQGHHEFTYALYVHEGDWKKGHTMEQALDLNVPAISLPATKIASGAFFNVPQENILLDTIKKAEDEEAVIIRLYEYYNRRTQAVIESQQSIQRAVLCNLLEENEEELHMEANQIHVAFAPYEVQTIKIFFE